jgi:hypothetical protein
MSLGNSLGGDSWRAWRVLLLAAMGEELEPEELTIFKEFTGRDKPPPQRIDEFWCAIGRRGGKSRAMAALAVCLAGLFDYKDKLVRGERGIVVLLAPDMCEGKPRLRRRRA